jgi:hypothetical protein
MALGLYNSRPIYDLLEEQEHAYWQDFITHLKEMLCSTDPTGLGLVARAGTEPVEWPRSAAAPAGSKQEKLEERR